MSESGRLTAHASITLFSVTAERRCMSSDGRFGEPIRSAYELAREKQLPAIAAGLAYYEFNSLIPFAVLLIVGLATAGELQAVLAEIQALTNTGATNRLLGQLGRASAGRVRAALIALFILLWSAMQLLRTVDGVFVDVYGGPEERSRFATAYELVITFVTFALAVSLLVILGAVLSPMAGGLALTLLAPVGLFFALLVAFFPMYYVFPEVRMTVREALPGAVFAAAGWTLSGVFFGLYSRVSQSVQLYGVAGGLLLLLTWLYVGGFLILMGVVLNASLAGHVDLESTG